MALLAAPPPAQEGGAVLGRGRYARVVPLGGPGPDTLAAYVLRSARTGGPAVRARLHSMSGSVRTLLGRDAVGRLAACIEAEGKSDRFIARVASASDASDRRRTFLDDLRQTRRVAALVPRGALDRTTTIGGPWLHELWGRAVVLGLEVLDLGDGESVLYATFARRCAPVPPCCVHADPARFATDALQALAALHGAGLVHTDVHTGNFVHGCAAARAAGSYRLIDWEHAHTVEELARRYLGHERPRSFSSPLAWYAWGLTPRAAAALAVALHVALRPSWMVRCRGFVRFLATATASFLRFMEAAEAEGLYDRGAVLRRYAFSFDLYDLGVILAHESLCSCRAHAGGKNSDRRRVRELAVRLTHLDHPERLLGASAALKWWLAGSTDPMQS